MKKLLSLSVVAILVAASQNSAQAVLVNVLIDNFDAPAAPLQASAPGGATLMPLAPGVIADSRTLTGAAAPPALTAGSTGGPGTGDMEVNLAANTSATLSYALSGANMMFAVANPTIFLTDVSGAFGSMTVEAFFGMTSLGTRNVAAGPVQDLMWVVQPGDAALGTNQLSFVFTSGEGGFFGGTTRNVVANPEPATMALMGLGVLGGAIGYRRRRKDSEVVPSSAA